MTILYALVGRGTVVLAEFSAVTGNAGAVARRILEKLPSQSDDRLSFSQDRHIFHILRADGFTFLCMAIDTFGRRIPFAYLEDIHMRFMKTYGRTAQNALAYAMNDEFSRVLHQQMEYYSSNPNADTIMRMKSELNERNFAQNRRPKFRRNSATKTVKKRSNSVKIRQKSKNVHTVMVESIERVLDRGERIELLVDKTSTLQDNSFHFRKHSRKLRQALWMKNVKLFASLTCLIVLVLYFIIAFFCGGITLSSCRS